MLEHTHNTHLSQSSAAIRSPSSSLVDGNSTQVTRAFHRMALDDIDAEASSILIALANQSPRSLNEKSSHTAKHTATHGSASVYGRSNDEHTITAYKKGHATYRTASPPSTLLTQQEIAGNEMALKEIDETLQDPIMMLAAAAATIECRPEFLKSAPPERAAVSRSPPRPRRLSDKGHYMPTKEARDHTRQKRNSIHYSYHQHHYSQGLRPAAEAVDKKTEFPDDYYTSMKRNPRIKRNAMHAYITYLIYTDRVRQRQQQQRQQQGDPSLLEKQRSKIKRSDTEKTQYPMMGAPLTAFLKDGTGPHS
ncbi:hypothetical protein BCR43DRAFT_526478 [Syncephalastrum racemosum]|uniref:Uncharacterized protein n=1 Tax=Syncephalastrum racemosum TaxID=13706 RepID=A0A1X2H6G7_SYNRA|nr:hypothetical protein BCR43DRAFT_526478 [Syncephalastrum racemosum]